MVESAFYSVWSAAFIGLILSVFIERLMIPRPILLRAWHTWVLHSGLWLLAFSILVLLLARPWFAMTSGLAILLMLVIVNNAKFHSLREPFVWHDFEYFTDAIKYPRLYIPFLGWRNFFLAATGFIIAVMFGLFAEAIPEKHFDLNGQFGGIVTLLLLSLTCIIFGKSTKQKISFDANSDVVSMGLLTSLWHYANECKNFPSSNSPYNKIDFKKIDDKPLPHIITIQSESFFDARSLFSGIKSDVLSEFDRLKKDAIMHGKLQVPAWGANTVRSEFAFLTALTEEQLGVHRFNPYRAVAKGWKIQNFARYLKGLGYRTIAIHPHPITFYQRNHVYPKLGFDEFLDIRSFKDADRFGPYISDLEVSNKIKEILEKSKQPLFIFAITMENHGPLHLEKVQKEDIKELYTTPPPEGCNDLTIYLRHLRNADKMIASLRQTLEKSDYSAKLCWYGDHVPIMPSVYTRFATPNGEVDYILWSNEKNPEPKIQNMSITDLTRAILSNAL